MDNMVNFTQQVNNSVQTGIGNVKKNPGEYVEYLILAMCVFLIGFFIVWIITKTNLKDANCDTITRNFSHTLTNGDYCYETAEKIESIGFSDVNEDYDKAIYYNDDEMDKLEGDFKLRDFYVKTAYNCCATGGFTHNFVDTCALKHCIEMQARCLDFEIYSYDDRPVIALSSQNDYNIKESYNYLEFDDVMKTISDYAFSRHCQVEKKVDPMILHFRIKSSNINILNKMAQSIFQHFSEKILPRKFSYEYNNKDLGEVAIKDLREKIVIMINKVDDGNNSIVNIEESELYEYVNIISGGADMRLFRLDDAKLNGQMDEIQSWNKSKLTMVLPNNSNNPSNIDWEEMSHRVNTLNNDIIQGYGIQFIGQCFQYNDSYLTKYHEDFNTKKRAFILKPKKLRKQIPSVTVDIASVQKLGEDGANAAGELTRFSMYS
tara:strand:+ start:2095 stop:3393 length:1299 start_codon:yes stop_codon:yes gene_type:complete